MCPPTLASVVRSSKKPSGIAGALGFALAAGLPAAPPASKKPAAVASKTIVDRDIEAEHGSWWAVVRSSYVYVCGRCMD